MGTAREEDASAGRGEGGESRQTARRTQILQGATAVFARLGYHGARMDDIVKESGLSKGTIYWYFTSKEEIAVELVHQLLRAEEESMELPREEGVTPEARLGAMAKDFTRSLREDPVRAPLALELLALGQRIPAIKTYFAGYHEKYLAVLAELLGAASGRAPTEQRVRSAAVAVTAMVDGWALHEALNPEHAATGESLGEAVAVLIDGLRS
ncbi:TetR/AcrR family transcriptional regulator [Streptomyces niveus]|uniref:TetR/AcrR family transcriptional regulator n=1 Tax=Streptomyces niveus TaxID=193462 RepID=UPI0035DD2C48